VRLVSSDIKLKCKFYVFHEDKKCLQIYEDAIFFVCNRQNKNSNAFLIHLIKFTQRRVLIIRTGDVLRADL